MYAANIIKNGIYYLTIFFITLTGFAQMPIFKRYYVADIPGFGWLANFYLTHRLHYIFAVLFTAVMLYAVTRFLITPAMTKKKSKVGLLKLISIIGLIITGGLMVFKNFNGVYMPPNLIIALDVSHLSFCMIFLLSLLLSLFRSFQRIKD